MLLHSREGAGERRLVDLNAIVEDSLNLAYHGARAENQAFQIRLERSFDPAAGQVDLFPQEMTRVLLNLISNGFYAATQRKAEMKDGYEPILAAATTGFDDRVEIRIRDNGSGIPPEVKEKIFNPFFTTKPPGQGTGLGLSLSHDIVVKQHAGSIEVDTKPGEFTEFRIVLPRAPAAARSSRPLGEGGTRGVTAETDRCPTGKSGRFPIVACQALFGKIFLFYRNRKSVYMLCRPVPPKGRLAIVTDAGRDAVDAGSAFDEGIFWRTAKSCGPGASTPASSLAEDIPARRRRQTSPITGESTKETVKTIARGMPGETGVLVVTTLVYFVFYRTRGCGRIERPAFPAPSTSEGAGLEEQTSREKHAARSRSCALDCRHCEGVIQHSSDAAIARSRSVLDTPLSRS